MLLQSSDDGGGEIIIFFILRVQKRVEGKMVKPTHEYVVGVPPPLSVHTSTQTYRVCVNDISKQSHISAFLGISVVV